MSNAKTEEKAKEADPETEPVAPGAGSGAFSAKMQDSKILKGMVDAVSAIIDETYFVAGETGLNLSAMDESHICFMGAHLPKALFDAGYECPRQAKMGINLEDLTKVMKRGGASDAIEFKHAVDGEKFQVLMKGKGTRTFILRLVDIDEEKLPPTAELDVQFDAKVTLDVGVLDEAIKDAEIYQDTLEVQINKDGVRFSAEGEVGDIAYELPKGQLDAAVIQTERVDETGKAVPVPPARGVFSLSFLKNILKIKAITDKVTLSLAENVPLKLEFPVVNPNNNEQGTVWYYLAPRVEAEESYEGD
jgi:proliferating cell nuclear antigen